MSRSTVMLMAASMVTLLGVAAIARADVVYEYTDAKGQVHYTDQWVPGAKLIRTETARGSQAQSAMQGIQNLSNDASNDAKQQEAAQTVQGDEAKARAAQCTQAKTQYQQMIASRRIYTVDKSGARHYLSDADADAARVQAKQAMDAACGTGT